MAFSIIRSRGVSLFIENFEALLHEYDRLESTGKLPKKSDQPPKSETKTVEQLEREVIFISRYTFILDKAMERCETDSTGRTYKSSWIRS